MKTPSSERIRGVLARLTLASMLVAGAAHPQPELTAAVKQEARQRFDAGLEAYDAGDFEGALAEFARAYELTSHPLVLYNIGLVHAKRDDPVASVTALETVLSHPHHGLDADRLALARSTLQSQSARLGALVVTTNAAGARLQIDGLDVTESPGQPVQVRAGVHQVSVMAAGFAPAHRRVTVASGNVQQLTVPLEPLDQALAHLTITTNVSDVSVIVNGMLMGMTPLSSSLAFSPGQHRIRLERVGYLPVERSIDLQPGSSGSLSLPLSVDPQTSVQTVGRLELSVSEKNAIVLLDGVPAISSERGFVLPRGRHRLVVQRDGFYDLERDVVVAAHTRLDVELLPEPDYLRNYVESAKLTRTWAWISTGGGAAAVGGGTSFLLWNHSQKDSAERAFDEQAAIAEAEPSGACGDDTCARLLQIRLNRLREVRDRDVWGYLAVGAGAVALGTGVVLLLTGDDPERYAPEPESDVFSRMRFDVGLGGPLLRGTF